MVIFVGVDTMVAWRDSQIVVVTYTARMHARMRRRDVDVSGRRLSSRGEGLNQCTTTYYSDRKICF